MSHVKLPEQAEPTRGRRSAYHQHLKRAARRMMRRLGKVLLDDAPQRLVYRGYES